MCGFWWNLNDPLHRGQCRSLCNFLDTNQPQTNEITQARALGLNEINSVMSCLLLHKRREAKLSELRRLFAWRLCLDSRFFLNCIENVYFVIYRRNKYVVVVVVVVVWLVLWDKRATRNRVTTTRWNTKKANSNKMEHTKANSDKMEHTKANSDNKWKLRVLKRREQTACESDSSCTTAKSRKGRYITRQ